MSASVVVRCTCGRLRGVVTDVGPDTVNHCLCYCRDCRAYLHWLGRDALLDAWGGAELVQVARARIQIDEGLDALKCLRLSPKGLHRWYADCCRTPIANTMPRVPFAGLSRACLDTKDESLFPEVDLIHPRSAVGGLPRGSDGKVTLRSLARPGRLFAIWLARGLGHPSPFHDRGERPRVEPRVLTTAERDALRTRLQA